MSDITELLHFVCYANSTPSVKLKTKTTSEPKAYWRSRETFLMLEDDPSPDNGTLCIKMTSFCVLFEYLEKRFIPRCHSDHSTF